MCFSVLFSGEGLLTDGSSKQKSDFFLPKRSPWWKLQETDKEAASQQQPKAVRRGPKGNSCGRSVVWRLGLLGEKKEKDSLVRLFQINLYRIHPRSLVTVLYWRKGTKCQSSWEHATRFWSLYCRVGQFFHHSHQVHHQCWCDWRYHNKSSQALLLWYIHSVFPHCEKWFKTHLFFALQGGSLVTQDRTAHKPLLPCPLVGGHLEQMAG